MTGGFGEKFIFKEEKKQKKKIGGDTSACFPPAPFQRTNFIDIQFVQFSFRISKNKYRVLELWIDKPMNFNSKQKHQIHIFDKSVRMCLTD